MSRLIVLSGPLYLIFIKISIQQMKAGFDIQQNHKDASQELIRRILNQNALFNSLTIPLLNEIFTAFKIVEVGMMERNDKLKKIKQKLIDIIIDEKQEAVNYLTLPKFKTLSENAKSTLKQVISQTWTLYQKDIKEDEKNRKYAKYFCRTENLKQSQDFHLGLYMLIRNYYFFQNAPFFRPPMPTFAPMMAPHPHSTDFTGFPPIQMPPPLSQMPQMSQMPPIHSMPDPYYSMQMQNSSHPPNNNIKIQQKQINNTNYDHSLSVRQQPIAKINKKHVNNDDYSLPPYFSSKLNRVEKQTTIFKAFSNCACKGKISDVERYFQCNQCKKRYHLLCLHIPTNAVEKVGVEKQCPQCSFKNTYALYSVIGEPLQSFWSDDRELHKQKITIKSKKCKQILDKKCFIQLRFLKIQGRCMFDWEGSSSSVKEQPNIVVKPQKSKLNEVIIKDDVLNKGGGQDVKISLDCMKPQDKNQDRKPILLYVTLNIIKQKTLQQIMATPYQSCSDSYLDSFLGNREQLKIQIFDDHSKLISIPVRGSDCSHPQVFDLKQFANHCLDFHTDACFYCSKKCKTFLIDRKIQAEINKIRLLYPQQYRQPHTIYYQKNGTFVYKNEVAPVIQTKQKNDKMDPEVDDVDSFPDLSLSMSQDGDDQQQSKEQKNKKAKEK